MMRRLITRFFVVLILALTAGRADAIEIVRQKNVATYIVFPIVDADGDSVTGAAGLDSEGDVWSDGTAPDGFADFTNEATEIGTTGIYYLSITATEMNNDYIYAQIKTTTTGAKTQHILLRTIAGDPLNLATTDDGGSINVTSGVIDTVTTSTNVTTVNGLAANIITAAAINTGAITSAKFAAGAIDASAIAAFAITSSEFAQSAADLVWSTTTRTITGGTVTTNSDKTGYALTTLESLILHSGTAQAGAAGTITLAAGASGTNNLYKGLVIKIYGGTGAGQARTITAYDGTTKVATVAWNWATDPDNTSTYGVLAAANPSLNSSLQVATTASDPWATALPGAYGAGTAGKIIGDNLNATVSSRSSHSAADVWTSVTRTLTALDEDSTILDLNATTIGTVTSVTNGVTVSTNNDKTGYALSAAGVDAVWDEVTTGHTTTSSYGKLLTDNINATVSSRASQTSVDTIDDFVDTEVAAIKAKTDQLTFTTANQVDATTITNSDKTGYALSAAGIDAIWDEAQSGHITAGTFGRYLDAQVSAVTAPSAATVADAVWDEALSGHTTAGTAGKKLSDLPTSGTGDWTAGEKSLILQSLGIDDGDVDTGATMDGLYQQIRRTR